MASELSDAEADHDPVIAEYDIYITPPNESQQLYVLQYPNRARDDTSAKRKPPSGMRIKPSSGFMEIDMPIHFTNYDKTRGMRWGESMKQAQEDGVSSFGMAGGFAPFVRARGRHGPVSRRREDGEREAANGDMDIDEPGGPTGRLGAAFEQAREQGRVLASQTLGGQIVDREPGRPLYMVAAFQGPQCHMTPATGVVQMRPQFHHVDAQTRAEQIVRKRATGESYAAEPQAMFDRAKATDGTDEPDHLQTLNKARAEPWTNLHYYHEETSEAYEEYYESLFVHDPGNAPAVVSAMSNDDYLDAISAPRSDPSGRLKKRPMTRKQMKHEGQGSDDSDEPVESDRAAR